MELTLHHLFPLKLIFLYLFANALVCFGYFEGFHFASFIVSLSLTLCVVSLEASLDVIICVCSQCLLIYWCQDFITLSEGQESYF